MSHFEGHWHHHHITWVHLFRCVSLVLHASVAPMIVHIMLHDSACCLDGQCNA